MGNIFYILKIGVITVVLIIFMQINFGQETLENKAENFIRQSSIMEPIRQVADGGFIAAKNLYRNTIEFVDSIVTKQFRSENAPGKRKLIELKRSIAFEKEQEDKRRSSLENNETEDLE